MQEQVDTEFLERLNQHAGIAHKVSRIYFNDVHEREDALQEMMYQLWRSYRNFRGNSKFSTWMYAVCLNTAITYRKRNLSRVNESLGIHHLQIPSEEERKDAEDVSLLYQAIGTLSPINKAIVLLYLDDLPYEEIASLTGLTRSNVSVRLVRIKKELEAYINKKKQQ